MSASASPVLPDQNQRRDAVSRYQAEHGSEVDDILAQRRVYVESQARDFEVDPDLVRAVVKYKALSEDFRSSAVVKAPDMGEASDPMSRAIQGAAVWLGEARKQLQKNGVDAPSNEQILDQYAAQRKAEHPNGAGMLRVMYHHVTREGDAAQTGGQDVLKEIARSQGKPEHIGLYVAPTAKLGETKEQREDAEIDEAIAKRFQREHPILWRLTEVTQGAKSNIPVFDSKSDDEDKSILQKRRDLLSLREINGSAFNPAGMFVQDNGNGQLGINYRGIGAFGGSALVGMGAGMLGGAKLPRLNLRRRYEAVVTNASEMLKKETGLRYDSKEKWMTLEGKPISPEQAFVVVKERLRKRVGSILADKRIDERGLEERDQSVSTSQPREKGEELSLDVLTSREKFSPIPNNEPMQASGLGPGAAHKGEFIKPITGFGPGSLSRYKAFLDSSGDDALLGFVQNGKVILYPVEAGKGFGHAGVFEAGLLENSGSTGGFQIIRYKGKLYINPHSELNGGALSPTIQAQIQNLLER